MLGWLVAGASAWAIAAMLNRRIGLLDLLIMAPTFLALGYVILASALVTVSIEAYHRGNLKLWAWGDSKIIN